MGVPCSWMEAVGVKYLDRVFRGRGAGDEGRDEGVGVEGQRGGFGRGGGGHGFGDFGEGGGAPLHYYYYVWWV